MIYGAAWKKTDVSDPESKLYGITNMISSDPQIVYLSCKN